MKLRTDVAELCTFVVLEVPLLLSLGPVIHLEPGFFIDILPADITTNYSNKLTI